MGYNLRQFTAVAGRYIPGSAVGLFIVAAALSGVFDPSAVAQDMSLGTVVSEEGVFNDNIELQRDSDGWVFGSITTVTSKFISKSPVTAFNTKLEADYNRFFGPGASSDLNSLDWLAGAGIDREFDRTRLGIQADYRQQSVRKSELEDTGQTQGNVDRETIGASAHANYDATDIDLVSVTGGYRNVDFDGNDTSGQRNPYKTASATVSWARKLSPTETGTLNLDGIYYNADDPFRTISQSVSADVLYESLLTSRFRYWAGGGLGGVRESREPANSERQTEVSLTTNLEAGVGYSLERVTVDLSYSQQIEPSAGGSLRQYGRVQLHMGYEATEQTTIDLSGLYLNRYDDVEVFPFRNVSRTYGSFEARLTSRLLPHLLFLTGYRFKYNDDDNIGGTAQSHAIFARLSYDFTLLP